jgi:hypothetical protein
MSQDHRPESDAEQPQAYPRKNEDRDHGDVIEQHRQHQPVRRAARCILAFKPAREAKREHRHPGHATDRHSGGGPSPAPSSSSTTINGAASSANPVTASTAPVTESSDFGLATTVRRTCTLIEFGLAASRPAADNSRPEREARQDV